MPEIYEKHSSILVDDQVNSKKGPPCRKFSLSKPTNDAEEIEKDEDLFGMFGGIEKYEKSKDLFDMFGGIEEYGEVEDKEKVDDKKAKSDIRGQNKIIVLSDTETDDLDYEALKNDDNKIYDVIRPNKPIIPSSLAKICDEMGKALPNQNNFCFIDCVVELIDRLWKLQERMFGKVANL
ncbi:hypothetical protein BC941DRAFT_444730 [Chlamydoabsidia padenii]|nr:hypothetical protein BC941DRAFT_444730 [Chlamydoabsidia padenii]